MIRELEAASYNRNRAVRRVLGMENNNSNKIMDISAILRRTA